MIRHSTKDSTFDYQFLGDIVKVAIMGEIRKGVIVGLRQKQVNGVPKFDTNNIVLINEDGSPIGTQITTPIPHQLKDILKQKTVFKRADYTKVLKIASSFI